MMPETEAIFFNNGDQFSCTVVIGRAVLFFGGEVQSRQISQLNPLGLIRIGTLPFAFNYGMCLVMGSQLFLGFTWAHENSCWSR